MLLPYRSYIGEPLREPVSVTELAFNLRLTANDTEAYAGIELGLLQRLIRAARQEAENYTGRALALRLFKSVFARFNFCMPICIGLVGIESICYYDADNNLQQFPLTNYQVETVLPIGEVEIISDFPTLSSRKNPIEIIYKAGFETADDAIKQAVILLASHFYENREASSPLSIKQVPLSYQWLLDSYRIPVL